MQTDSLRYFFKSAVQFSTTVVGCAVDSSRFVVTRKRWPSLETAYQFLGPGRLPGTRRSNSALGTAGSKLAPSAITSTAISFLSAEM